MKPIASDSFKWHRSGHCWRFHSAAHPTWRVESVGALLEVDGKPLRLSAAGSVTRSAAPPVADALGGRFSTRLVATFASPSLRWEIQYEHARDGSHLICRARLTNLGRTPLRISRCYLMAVERSAGGRVYLGNRLDQGLIYLFKYHSSTIRRSAGRYELNPMALAGSDCAVKRLMDAGGRHAAHDLCMLYNPADSAVLLAGALSFRQAPARQVLTADRRQGVTEWLAGFDFLGQPLAPGRSFDTDELLVTFNDNPYRALENWAEQVQLLNRPRLSRQIPVGWVGWSWVDLQSARETASAQAVVLENARAIRKRLKGFSVNYLWISLLNIKDQLPGNWLEFDRKYFPGGFPAVLRRLRALGFKPGLWVAPFWMFRDAVRVNRDQVLKRPDGTPLTLQFHWPYTNIKPADGGKTHAVHMLDGSHPGALRYMREVFRTYRRMGVRYYMLDFLGGTMNVALHDLKLTWRAAEQKLMRTIRAAAGRDTFLLSAVGSNMMYLGSVDSMRVNVDYGEGRPFYPPYRDFYNATFALHDTSASNHLNLLQNAAATYFVDRRLYIQNYNTLTVDQPIPRSSAEITATLFGMSGSSLTLGDDLRRIAPERLELIKKCLPRTDRAPFPADLFTSVGPGKYPRILLHHIQKRWERYTVAAVFNLDQTPYAQRLTAEILGLASRTKYWVYDFWNGAYLGGGRDAWTCHVPPHSVRLLRFTPARTHPWLLSTDMHIQQGNVEVTDLRWSPRRMILSGALTRPVGESGNLFVLMPPGFRLVNHEGHWLVKDVRDGAVVIRREIVFRKSHERWAMRFAPLAEDLPPTAASNGDHI